MFDYLTGGIFGDGWGVTINSGGGYPSGGYGGYPTTYPTTYPGTYNPYGYGSTMDPQTKQLLVLGGVVLVVVLLMK